MKRMTIFLCAVLAVLIVMPCAVALCVELAAEKDNGGNSVLTLSSDRLGTYGRLLVDYGQASDIVGNNVSLQQGTVDWYHKYLEENSGAEDDNDKENSGASVKNIEVKVYFHKEDIVRKVDLEEYLAGVVLGEMMISFEEEALKAQAIAARSYTLYMMEQGEGASHKDGAVICTDHTHCQTWKDPAELYNAYPEEQAEKYYEKLMRVIDDTKGKILMYEGKVVQAYYFDNSGGFTESYDSVWGGENLDYTQSIPCMGEADKDNFCTLDYFSAEEFLERFKKANENVDATAETVFSTIKILSRTESNRIDEMSVGGVVFKGTAMRSILGLKSTNVIFRELDDGRILTVTFGYGHGVGMSQWGAQAMAERGSTAEEILKYYYKGVEIVNLYEL